MGDLQKYINYIPIVLLSFTFAIIVTPLIMKLAHKIGAVSKPQHLRDEKERGYTTHIHKGIIPKLGFLPIILPIFVVTPIFLRIDLQIAAIFISLLLLTIFGIFDDIYNLSGKLQFLLLSFCSFFVIFAGINITEANNPFTDTFLNFDRGRVAFEIFSNNVSFSLLSIVITFFWLMIVINAINWNDGVDGVLNGNVSIASLIILLVSIRDDNTSSAVLSALLLGSNLGLLKYNFYPAKIFNSYGGQISGFLIGILAITSQVKLPIAILIIVFPLVDFLWVLFGRLKRIKPKTPKDFFSILNVSDTTHLHHRLMSLGYGKRRVAFVEYICTFIAGLAAILLSGLQITFLILSSCLLVLLIFIFLDKIIARKKNNNA
ncbi:MAG: MraY family glycosyltransferase [bacterium]